MTDDHNKKSPIQRQLARCKTCRRWWSVLEVWVQSVAVEKCPCGGELELADFAAHQATLPYVPYVADPPKKKD